MNDRASQVISIRIAIDIPVDVAPETLAKIEPMLARLSSATAPAALPAIAAPGSDEQPDPAEEARRTEIREHYENQKRQFARMIVQAYRTFRRTVDQYERPYEAYRAIAQAYEWPTSLVQSEVSRRRKLVNRYIKQRLHRTVLALAIAGWTNKAIADRLALHDRTVARLLREARKASFDGGQHD